MNHAPPPERKPRITGDDFHAALHAAIRAGKVRVVRKVEIGERRWDGLPMSEVTLEIVDDEDAAQIHTVPRTS